MHDVYKNSTRSSLPASFQGTPPCDYSPKKYRDVKWIQSWVILL